MLYFHENMRLREIFCEYLKNIFSFREIFARLLRKRKFREN